VTLPIFGVLASLVLKLPDIITGVLIPLLSLTVLIESIALIFLLDKYRLIKKFLNEEHPNINLDALEESETAFDEEATLLDQQRKHNDDYS